MISDYHSAYSVLLHVSLTILIVWFSVCAVFKSYHTSLWNYMQKSSTTVKTQTHCFTINNKMYIRKPISSHTHNAVFLQVLQSIPSHAPTQTTQPLVQIYTASLWHSTTNVLLLHYQQHQKDNLYSPLCLCFIWVTMRSSSSCCSSRSSCLLSARGRQ